MLEFLQISRVVCQQNGEVRLNHFGDLHRFNGILEIFTITYIIWYSSIYIASLIHSLGQYILGDVKIDGDGTLQIYYTINESTGTKDWVSICYREETVEAIANVACRQHGNVGAMKFGRGSQK